MKTKHSKSVRRADWKDRLYDYISGMEIIDAHEHFKPEKQQLTTHVDFSCILLYAENDLVSDGMKHFNPHDASISPEEKWKRIKPHWNAVKHGGYGQGVRINIKRLTGEDDLHDGNWRRLTEILQAQNKPGIYRRHLRNEFHIRKAVVSNGTRAIEPFPYSKSDLELFRLIIGCFCPRRIGELEYYETATGHPWKNLQQMRDGIRKLVAEAAADPGVVGFKCVAQPCGVLDRKGAETALRTMRKAGQLERPAQELLNRFFYEEAFAAIRATGLPVAVHCGVWGDVTMMDIRNFVPWLTRFPDIRFDLFHMSMPSTREMAFAVKNFANAWGNLCWSPCISPVMFENALDEWIDIVPMTKIMGFGGDIIHCPQLVWGYLEMCRQSLARVLGRRIDRGLMDFDDACSILRLWMHDNPTKFYGL